MGTALRVGGIYVLLVGILLLFPAWGAAVFGRPVMDAAVTSGWGAALIGIGLITIVAASDVTKYGGLAGVFVASFLISTLDLIYFWITGAYTARNVLVPVVLNVAIAAWIWSTQSKG